MPNFVWVLNIEVLSMRCIGRDYVTVKVNTGLSTTAFWRCMKSAWFQVVGRLEVVSKRSFSSTWHSDRKLSLMRIAFTSLWLSLAGSCFLEENAKLILEVLLGKVIKTQLHCRVLRNTGRMTNLRYFV